MLINEIEIVGSSISLKCWSMKVKNVEKIFDMIMNKADMFMIISNFLAFTITVMRTRLFAASIQSLFLSKLSILSTVSPLRHFSSALKAVNSLSPAS